MDSFLCNLFHQPCLFNCVLFDSNVEDTVLGILALLYIIYYVGSF